MTSKTNLRHLTQKDRDRQTERKERKKGGREVGGLLQQKSAGWPARLLDVRIS